MASIRKRGELWQARVQVAGTAVAKSFPSQEMAEKWAAITEADIVRRVYIHDDASDRITLGEALKRYETTVTPTKRGAEVERFRIAALRRTSLAKKALGALTPADLAKYRDERGASVAPNTLRREIGLVGHLFKIARSEWGYTSLRNPAEGLRLPAVRNARTRRLVGDEEARLIAAFSKNPNKAMLPLVTCAVESAMRLGELLALTWRDLDLTGRVARLKTSKNGDGREVPLSSKFVQAVEGLPGARSGSVFGLTASAVKQAWTRGVARARRTYVGECNDSGTEADPDLFNDLHFHDLRREATTRLAKRLAPFELAKMVGHRDLKMTLNVYYRSDAAALASKLD